MVGIVLGLGFFTPLLFSGEFLYYGLVFLGLAIVAGLVGFGGIAGITMEIARIFILIFLVLAIISILL